MHKGRLAKQHLTARLASVAAVVLLVLLPPGFLFVAALVALYHLWLEEDLLVRAGQALRIS
jgi:hypothetical protein